MLSYAHDTRRSLCERFESPHITHYIHHTRVGWAVLTKTIAAEPPKAK